MTVQYISSYCKKKKNKIKIKKYSVQQQCNICRLKDHLVLFIILDALCVYGKDIWKSPWPNYLVLFKFSLKKVDADCDDA